MLWWCDDKCIQFDLIRFDSIRNTTETIRRSTRTLLLLLLLMFVFDLMDECSMSNKISSRDRFSNQINK